MTLIVARLSHGEISIASDTMLTEHGRPLPRSRDVIKTRMLPGDVCVSYAGSPDLADKCFLAYVAQHRSGHGYDDMLKFFECDSIKTNNDYIVCFYKLLKIVAIKNGARIITPAKTVWIGDKVAYEAFRRYEQSEENSPLLGRASPATIFADDFEHSPASPLYQAMRHVVNDVNCPCVGGFPCIVSSKPNGFRFAAFSDTLYDFPSDWPELTPIKATDKVSFGASGENAGYCYSQISTNIIGSNQVAFYYLRGGLLFAFDSNGPMSTSQCRVVRHVEPHKVVENLVPFEDKRLGWLVFILSSAWSPSVSIVRQNDFSENGMELDLAVHENTLVINEQQAVLVWPEKSSADLQQ